MVVVVVIASGSGGTFWEFCCHLQLISGNFPIIIIIN